MSRTVRAIRSAGAPFSAGDGFEPIELSHHPVPVVLCGHAIDQILTIDVIDDKTVGQLDRMSVEPAVAKMIGQAVTLRGRAHRSSSYRSWLEHRAGIEGAGGCWAVNEPGLSGRS